MNFQLRLEFLPAAGVWLRVVRTGALELTSLLFRVVILAITERFMPPFRVITCRGTTWQSSRIQCKTSLLCCCPFGFRIFPVSFILAIARLFSAGKVKPDSLPPPFAVLTPNCLLFASLLLSFLFRSSLKNCLYRDAASCIYELGIDFRLPREAESSWFCWMQSRKEWCRPMSFEKNSQFNWFSLSFASVPLY